MTRKPLLLGCIADDFTGATDLANTLTRRGMSTVVLLGMPDEARSVPDADAVVIALKSRTARAGYAVRISVGSLAWLKRAGARQFYFKYCSTFDSTPQGNIGPVADALLEMLGESFTVICPAFPANARTVYKGHLFVGKDLLSESSMRDHPLTPMTDASLLRVLQAQTSGKVGLIPFSIVQRGADAIWGEMRALAAQGYRYAIVDALTDEHLLAAGAACADEKLLTGGSGLALGLPDNFRRYGLLSRRAGDVFPQVDGAAAVLAGSCSAATQRQVAAMRERCPSFELKPLSMRSEEEGGAAALAWAQSRLGSEPVLIYSTMTADRVAEVQAKLGREKAGELIERTFARIAQRLFELGVRRLVVAGGEISGAVVSALKIDALRIGQEIDPGVPWTTSLAADPIALALKSGNFGSDVFFFKAFKCLQ